MLGQNSINPFNARTAIELRIGAEYMTIDSFQPRGTTGILNRHSQRHDLRDHLGWHEPVKVLRSPVGVYLYRLRDDYRTWEVIRMLLIR